MIRNYFVVTVRSLKKHFSFSVINTLGLGLGIATAVLLITWIRHETSYDRFLRNADHIYRASLEYNYGGSLAVTAVSPGALLPFLKDECTGVVQGARVYNPSSYESYVIETDGERFLEGKFYYADSTLFDVFSYSVLAGNPRTCLSEPNSVVLTASCATKYFGTEKPLGKMITVNGDNFKITGVVQDPPLNGYLQFDLIGSISTTRYGQLDPVWWSAVMQTFIQVADIKQVSDLQEKTDEKLKEAFSSEFTSENDYVRSHFMNISDIHLHSNLLAELEPVGDIQYVYIFSVAAFLTLLIAIINYMNLCTARSSDRSKEVGVRKVVGALRRHLLFQFVGESFFVTLLSFILAGILVAFFLPTFNDVTGSTLLYADFLQLSFLLELAGMLILIALLAGMYPALIVSGFRPAIVLKGPLKLSGKDLWFRRTLVATQFCISLALIVCAMIIFNQLRFVQQKRLGYDNKNLISASFDSDNNDIYEALKIELIQNAHVADVGRSSNSPVNVAGGFKITLAGSSGQGLLITGFTIDEGFVPTVGLEIVAGRNITKQDLDRVVRDTVYAFILNEAAVKTMGTTNEEVIGIRADLDGRNGEVVGVVRDFHFSSLHSTIAPLIMFGLTRSTHTVMIRLLPGPAQPAIERVRATFEQMIPSRPFDYEFIDQQYLSLYSAEQRMGSLFVLFATLAIIIACLGLLGLVSFAVAQKAKEIGIRKVMGATISDIMMLITKDYAKPVFYSIIIALPVSVWVMNAWLDSFAYRTNIGALQLIIPSFICVLVAFGTASIQAFRAAVVNPTKVLRAD